MNKYSVLTKTCSSCGMQKPLTAFLQLADAQDSTYGNVCSACRKIQMQNKVASNESDGTTTSKTDHTLDSKVKIAGDVNKEQRFKRTEELYYKERDLEEEKQAQQNQKTESTAALEKKHRKEYIEKRARSMFDTKPNSPPASEKVAGGIRQIAQETEINVSEAVDTRRAKYLSPFFIGLEDWLGESAGLVSQAKKMAKMAKRTALEKTPEKQEPLPVTIEETWGPGSKRGK